MSESIKFAFGCFNVGRERNNENPVKWPHVNCVLSKKDVFVRSVCFLFLLSVVLLIS